MARRRKAASTKVTKKVEQEKKDVMFVVKNGVEDISNDDVGEDVYRTQAEDSTPIVHKKFGRITVNRTGDLHSDNQVVSVVDDVSEIKNELIPESDSNGLNYNKVSNSCDLQNVDYIMKKHTDELLDLKTSNNYKSHSAVYKIENDIPLDGSVIIKPGAFSANTITTSVIVPNNNSQNFNSISHGLNLLNVIKGIQMLEGTLSSDDNVSENVVDLSLPPLSLSLTNKPINFSLPLVNNEDCENVSNCNNFDEYCTTSDTTVATSVNVSTMEQEGPVLKNEDEDEEQAMKVITDETTCKMSEILLEDKEDSLPSQAASDSSLSKASEEKLNDFSSRSVSTDTTESENSSNSSSVIRRSNRLRSLTLKKQEQETTANSIKVESVKIDTPLFLETGVSYVGSPSSVSQLSGVSFDLDKPVKVKSRWRRSSELEMHVVVGKHDIDYVESSSPSPQKQLYELPEEKEARIVKEAKDVADGLGSFVQLEENEYKMERNPCKGTKRMTCDCVLSKEEIARNEVGCGEDCLNRMLFLECGSRCALGDNCANKRFQRREYAKCNIFKTEMKGFGLRAQADLPSNSFIMEYVGEVVNPKEFAKRVKMYAKDKNRHFYFMALKADTIIDATIKGNISRFINHSCDPNAETQKWTINGELRVGFFTTRPVTSGEEITFDYQFQLYGKAAQKCYCGASICRGWIGKPPEEDDDEEEEEEEEEESEEEEEVEEEKKDKEVKEKVKVRSRKPKSAKAKKKIEEFGDMKTALDDFDLEEEIQKLAKTGLKNRAHTLTLSRLMVRAEDWSTRSRLLKLIREADQACRRLFLDYHGLRLICGWMLNCDGQDRTSRCIQILETLAQLPIPHKTMLVDSKVLGTVEMWAKKWSESVARDRTPSLEDDDGKKPKDDIPFLDDEPADDTSSNKQDQSVVKMAESVLESWSSLKEGFKIPKKERIEEMKEHEREADRGYKEYLDKQENVGVTHYDRYGRYKIDRIDRKRVRDSPTEPEWFSRSKYKGRSVSKLSKTERRHLFALKVQQEDEEARKQQEMWKEHEARCLALGLDPNTTTPFDPSPLYPVYFDQGGPPAGAWPPPEPGMCCYPPDSAMYNAGYYEPSPGHPVPGPGLPIPYVNYPPEEAQTYPENQQQVQAAPADIPQNTPLKLPPKWKSANDDKGRTYYYHVKERVSQWEPPKWSEEDARAEAIRALAAEMEDSSSSSESSDTTSDEDDEDDEEEDEGQGEDDLDLDRSELMEAESNVSDKIGSRETVVPQASDSPVVTVGNEDCEDENDEELSGWEDEEKEDKEEVNEHPSSPQPVPHPKRREGLVQEIIISPRKEEDRVDPRKYKEVKLMLRKQKEEQRAKERQKMLKMKKLKSRGGVGSSSSSSSKSRSKRKKRREKGWSDGWSGSSSTESPTDRRIKENFKSNIAGAIVSHLNHYRKKDCKTGRITCNDDFKHLARKLTHFVMLKELKHCQSVEDLVCNDSVKTKARDFIKKYMIKFGPVYKRPKDED